MDPYGLNVVGFGDGGDVTANLSIMQMITQSGLTANLAIVLDAGDGNSYISGQVWKDVSGNLQDFHRGTTSASQASDPTFNGTAGANSAGTYWSLDGGDWFSEDDTRAGTVLTFADNWHKPPPTGHVYTIGFTMFANNRDLSPDTSALILVNCEHSAELFGPGFGLYVSSHNQLSVFTCNDDLVSGSNTLVTTFSAGDDFLPSNGAARTWVCGIISYNMANANTMIAKQNSSSPWIKLATHNTRPPPVSTVHSDNYGLLANPDAITGTFGDVGWTNTASVRFGSLFAWNRDLTADEMNTLYNLLDQRYHFRT